MTIQMRCGRHPRMFIKPPSWHQATDEVLLPDASYDGGVTVNGHTERPLTVTPEVGAAVAANMERLAAAEDAPRVRAANALPSAFTEPLEGAEQRWQYAVVNTGSFGTADRLNTVLASAGRAGWELVTIYDKASNWFRGIEKGFMMMKRPVPAGVTPDRWCIHITQTM